MLPVDMNSISREKDRINQKINSNAKSPNFKDDLKQKFKKINEYNFFCAELWKAYELKHIEVEEATDKIREIKNKIKELTTLNTNVSVNTGCEEQELFIEELIDMLKQVVPKEDHNDLRNKLKTLKDEQEGWELDRETNFVEIQKKITEIKGIADSSGSGINGRNGGSGINGRNGRNGGSGRNSGSGRNGGSGNPGSGGITNPVASAPPAPTTSLPTVVGPPAPTTSLPTVVARPVVAGPVASAPMATMASAPMAANTRLMSNNDHMASFPRAGPIAYEEDEKIRTDANWTRGKTITKAIDGVIVSIDKNGKVTKGNSHTVTTTMGGVGGLKKKKRNSLKKGKGKGKGKGKKVITRNNRKLQTSKAKNLKQKYNTWKEQKTLSQKARK
uniref:Uncharacterized protein n=1 Tax=viral metagenome TaxID=1070528 RepID=A0A6C0J8T0_9ZZZZ